MDTLPTELIAMIVSYSPTPWDYMSLLLSNSVFREAVSDDDRKKIKDGFAITVEEDKGCGKKFRMQRVKRYLCSPTPNGKRIDGTLSVYWIDQEHDSKEILIKTVPYVDGVKHGTKIVWNYNLFTDCFLNDDESPDLGIHQHVDYTTQYEKGLKHGTHQMWNRHALYKTGIYRQGKKVGRWRKMYRPSNISKTIFFADGIKHGGYIQKSTTMVTTGQYSQGKRDGLWCSRWNDVDKCNPGEYKGKLCAKGRFVLGKKHGTWRNWLSVPGSMKDRIFQSEYDNGSCIGETEVREKSPWNNISEWIGGVK